jgi:hypothetical protein
MLPRWVERVATSVEARSAPRDVGFGHAGSAVARLMLGDAAIRSPAERTNPCCIGRSRARVRYCRGSIAVPVPSTSP